MDKTLIDAAAKVLGIEAVYLRTSDVRCKDDFLPAFIENNLSLIPQYRVGPKSAFHILTVTNEETGDLKKVAMFTFAAGVRLIDGESLKAAEAGDDLPEDAVYVEIRSEFRAQYSLEATADEAALRPALTEFASYNVGYHVWPYWREYVQGICARMGIPSIPVPMYRISNLTLEIASDEE